MNNTLQPGWDAGFADKSPLFDPVRALVQELTTEQADTWPTLDDYQRLLDTYSHDLRSQYGATIHFVDQGDRPASFEQQYEPRIYLTGAVQTRRQNWHDFFQLLVWCQFPQTKARLNALHYHAARERQAAIPARTNRSAIENAITLFDECGIIIASSNPELLDLIRNMQWQQLFWQQRAELEHTLYCSIFGHALYEKALNPYIGLTGNALLIDVKTTFHQLDLRQQWHWLDAYLTEIFQSDTDRITTRLFFPFPLLGMPGWDKDNHHRHYYDNKNYFRDSRQYK